MTKVKVLGQEPKQEKELKPIELIKFLHNDRFMSWESKNGSIANFDTIVLLAKNYHDCGLDLMYLYRERSINSNSGNCLALGHFNDGVVNQNP